MRNLTIYVRFLLLAVIVLGFQSRLLAQSATSQAPGSALTSASIISKITTSPATTDVLDDGKQVNPALVNDGAAYIYLTPQYRGKVAKVVYDITRLHPTLNPARVSQASDDRIVLQGLHRSEYQVKEIYLKDGQVLRLDSLQRPLFTVHTIDPMYAPTAGTADDYTKHMEGSRVDAFRSAFARGQQNLKALQARTDLPQPILAGKATTKAGARMAVPCGYWQVVRAGSPCPAPAGSPNDGFIVVTFALQDCYGNTIYAYCYQHRNGGTAVGSLYLWDGSLLNPATEGHQVLNDFCCTPNAGSVTPTHPTCGQTRGSATYTGGSPNGYQYYYRWDNGPPTISNTVSNLSPGSHTVQISYTAEGLCGTSKTFTINAPPATPSAPSLSKTDPTCTTSSGSISVSSPVSGYQYSFDNGTYGTTTTWSGLTAGSTHTVEARNASGCESASTSITIGTASAAPAAPSLSKTDPSCTTPTGTVSVSSPVSGYQYSFDNGTYGTTTTWSGLAAGSTHTVEARNASGCESAPTSITIGTASAGGPDGEIQAPNAICATEPVQFQVTPATTGATYSWSATGNPTITGGTTNGNLTAKWDQPGVYTATVVISLNGCSKTVSKSINITAAVVVNAGADRTICKGGSTRIGTNAPAGSPSVSYSWSPTTGLDFPNSATPTANPAQTTIYTVTVTDLVNGCVKTDDVEVKVDVTLNPRALAGPDQVVSQAQPIVQIGTTQTSPNPWNGFAVDYLWTPISSGATVNELDDETARITNFTLPQPTNLTTWTYQLAVRKQVPLAAGNDGQSINHYCFAYDTVTITRAATSIVGISGNVFNDANGLIDNTVNGTPVNGPALPVYASLVSGGSVIGTVPVTATGAYSFTNVTPGSYTVVLTTNSAGSTTPSVPNSWINTGENIGTTPGNDGTPNGILPGITVTTTNVTDVNFGIEIKPVVVANTDTPRLNPGGTLTSPVSATVFSGTDTEDGVYPNNLTGRTVTLTPATNGTLYYNGTPVSTTTVITNFDPTKVSIDPTATGATTGSDPTFTYSVKDNAGVPSLPQTVVVPFTAPSVGISISGNVFNDANGLTDNTVNGTPVSTLGGNTFYANLVGPGGTVVATTTLTNGAYSFTGVSPNTVYTVVLSNTPGTVGSTPPPATLTGGVVNTGENIGTTPGSDGTPNGVISVAVATTNVTNVNFGVKQVPDLTPIITARQSTVYNTTPITVVVDVYELLNVPTSGLITVKVPKDPRFTLSFDPTATSVNGQAVQNSSWTYGGLSGGFYTFTTTNVIAGNIGTGMLSFGLTGTLTPGATQGTLTFSSIIVGGSGGEIRIDNNNDADKIDYFEN